MNTSKRRTQQAEALARRLQRQHEHEQRVQAAKTHRARVLFSGLLIANGKTTDSGALRALLAKETGFGEDIVLLWTTKTVPEFVFDRLVEAVERVKLLEQSELQSEFLWRQEMQDQAFGVAINDGVDPVV